MNREAHYSAKPSDGVCNHISRQVIMFCILTRLNYIYIRFPMHSFSSTKCKASPDLRTYRSVASSDKQTRCRGQCTFPFANSRGARQTSAEDDTSDFCNNTAAAQSLTSKIQAVRLKNHYAETPWNKQNVTI